jgi:hypothetical protein
LAAAHAEEVGDRARLAVREQDGVHALLQARAVSDEMEPPPLPLALGAYLRVGQPDRRHQVAAGELSQHPGVNAVGLARERREPLYLLRVGDLDPPAVKLEPIVHEACAVHRLDRCLNRLAVVRETFAQASKSVCVRQ